MKIRVTLVVEMDDKAVDDYYMAYGVLRSDLREDVKAMLLNTAQQLPAFEGSTVSLA